MVNKALPIAKAFYQGYSFLFLFDDAISHSVYVKDALRTTLMNKEVSGNNFSCAINGLKKTEPALHILYLFQTPMIPWYKKKSSEFLRKKICSRKKN